MTKHQEKINSIIEFLNRIQINEKGEATNVEERWICDGAWTEQTNPGYDFENFDYRITEGAAK